MKDFRRGHDAERVAVISDIHGNVEALDAVLHHIECRGISAIWCLGDVVGNGHDPVGCLDRVEARCSIALAGNHEVAIATRHNLPPATEYSRAALVAAGRLDQLRGRPSERAEGSIVLAHGCPSPFDPVRDYLAQDVAPDAIFDAHPSASLILVGHTHRAAVWTRGEQILVNVGSVGEPRDGDIRATWFEIGRAGRAAPTAFEHRVPFDSRRYAANMMKAGLDLPPMFVAACS